MGSLVGFRDGRRALWIRWVTAMEAHVMVRYSVARLRSQGLVRALTMWAAYTSDGVMIASLAKMRSPGLTRALRSWRSKVRERSATRTVLLRVTRYKNRGPNRKRL